MKPYLTTARRQWNFPDVKFHIAALTRYRRKQSGSGIQTMKQIHARVFEYLANRQTDRQTMAKRTSFVGGK